jgi:hypothetical protein
VGDEFRDHKSDHCKCGDYGGARLRNAILGDSLNTIPLYLFKLFLHDNLQRA